MTHPETTRSIWVIENDPNHILNLRFEFGDEFELVVSESVPAARGLIEQFKQGKVKKPRAILLDADLGTGPNGEDAVTLHAQLEAAGVLADDQNGSGALVIGNSAEHDMRKIIRPDFPAHLIAQKDIDKLRYIFDTELNAA